MLYAEEPTMVESPDDNRVQTSEVSISLMDEFMDERSRNVNRSAKMQSGPSSSRPSPDGGRSRARGPRHKAIDEPGAGFVAGPTAKIRVLVVEDEFFLASDVQYELESAGFEVAALCRDVDSAIAFLDANEVDCAVLDINLGGIVSFDIAERLKAQNVPFLFVTGYDERIIPVDYTEQPYIPKPARYRSIVDAVSAITRGTDPQA